MSRARASVDVQELELLLFKNLPIWLEVILDGIKLSTSVFVAKFLH